MGFFTTTRFTRNGKKETHVRWWISLLFSMLLSIGTWNPSGIHFVAYVTQGNPFEGFKPFYILVIAALWIMALKAISQSIKWLGAAIAAAVIVSFVWGLTQYDLIDTSSWSSLGWIVIIGVGLIVWLGMNASIIWKSLTGVYTTDATDED